MADVAVVNGSDNLPMAPLTASQSDAVATLLSLSFSEGGLAPGATPSSAVPVKAEPATQHAALLHTPSTSVPPPSTLSNGGKHHRRLSSTGKTRRRLSDAREAANRPSPSLLPSNISGLSLASLSLSSSPPPSYPSQLSTSFTGVSRRLAPAPPNGGDASSPTTSGNLSGGSIPVTSSQQGAGSIPVKVADDEPNDSSISIPSGRTGKKRGVDHKCETCSKIYRHPSCLIKHRWEHTPHWKEASKFVLSKHQQVQLLEAAAILSHMSPAVSGGRSLPDDRSLWPSFLSGGSLPPPDPAIRMPSTSSESSSRAQAPSMSPSNSYTNHPVSSSVPTRAMSSGPRLHDYGVSTGVVTQVRPGLIGVTTSTGGVAVIGDKGATNGTTTPSQPVPVPGGTQGRRGHDAFGGGSGSPEYYRDRQRSAGPGSYGGEESWGSYGYGSYQGPTVYSGGVSLPNSSVRSGSSPSRSLSRSRSGSIDESTARHQHRQRLSDDSPASDDGGVFDDMDGIEDDRPVHGIRIVGEGYGSRGHHHTASRSYGGFSNGYGGRRLMDDDLDYSRFAVREEDEDMDDMDGVGRLRKPNRPPLPKREEQWDGMEMEMDMD